MKKRARREGSGAVVLEEDDFLRGLTNVIRLAYFPDAPEVAEEDERARSDSKCPATIPQSECEGPGFDRKCLMSVDEYLAHFTSDKNEAFNKLQEDSVQEKKRQVPWFSLKADRRPNQMLLGDTLAADTSSRKRKEGEKKKRRRRIAHENTRLDFPDIMTEVTAVTEQTVEVDRYPFVSPGQFMTTEDILRARKRGQYTIQPGSERDKWAQRLGRRSTVSKNAASPDPSNAARRRNESLKNGHNFSAAALDLVQKILK